MNESIHGSGACHGNSQSNGPDAQKPGHGTGYAAFRATGRIGSTAPNSALVNNPCGVDITFKTPVDPLIGAISRR